MIIKRLIILDYINKRANEFNFSSKVNIITSNGTTVGKSSLIKSLYYALGYAIKQFPHGWNEKDMRFRVDIMIGDLSYTIIRNDTLFYVSDVPEALNLKEYSEWLQNRLGINMRLKLKGSSSQELSSVYATEILTPFYIDQDKSWNGYVYKNTSDSLGRYNNVPSDLLEYTLGISNEDILEKETERSFIKKNIREIDSKTKVLNSLQQEYAQNTEMLDSAPTDLEELEKMFESNLNRLTSISKVISKNKKEFFSKKSEKDILCQDNIELDKMLKVNKNSYKNVELECTYCHSELTYEQSLTRLKLKNNYFEIQHLSDINTKKIEKLENEMNNLRTEIIHLNESYNISSKEKEEISQVINLKKYIDLESKRLANKEFLNQIYELDTHKSELDILIRQLSKEINLLKKEQKERKADIENCYTETLKDINLRFGSEKISEIDFFDFREVKGSGMDSNKILLAVYLTYMNLISHYAIYKVPFGIDSFVKNEIDKETEETTFKEVENKLFTLQNQVFFATISENLKYFTDIQNYHILKLVKPILKEENYKRLASLVVFD